MKAVLFMEAALSLALSAGNALHFLLYARQASQVPRQVGAVALTLLNAGLAGEAIFYLLYPPLAGHGAGAPALLALRTLLLLSVTLIAVLIMRGAGGRRS